MLTVHQSHALWIHHRLYLELKDGDEDVDGDHEGDDDDVDSMKRASDRVTVELQRPSPNDAVDHVVLLQLSDCWQNCCGLAQVPGRLVYLLHSLREDYAVLVDVTDDGDYDDRFEHCLAQSNGVVTVCVWKIGRVMTASSRRS